MFNSKLPDSKDLPTSKQLLQSTTIAIVTAAVILITTILPAEYGIDPTGIGKVLELQKMGEIKASLKEDLKEEVVTTSDITSESALAIASVNTQVAPAEKIKMDSITFVLNPGQGAEIKLTMQKGDVVEYEWFTTGGTVNYDTHGDPPNPPKGFYHGYSKGRMVEKDNGVLEAAFHGKHGWFWRNRTENVVKLTLKTKGNYSEFKRVI